jgi:hypothetical protein
MKSFIRISSVLLLHWAVGYPTLASQNWALLHSKSIINFSQKPAQAIVHKTIYVEKTLIRGKDSVHVLRPRGIKSFNNYPYLAPMGSLLGDSVICRPRGLYECRFQPNPEVPEALQKPLMIYTLAEPGQRWPFRDTIQALVLSKVFVPILGQMDSVKTILLGTGDTLRWSKNFGFLQWKNEKTIGIQGSAGFQLPRNRDWYNWQAGDVFEFKSNNSSPQSQSATETWQKMTVLNREDWPEGLQFKVRMLRRIVHTRNFREEKPVFQDSVSIFKVADPNQLIFAGTYGSPLRSSYYTIQAQNSLKLDIYPASTPLGTGGPQQSSTRVMGLGITSSSFRYAEYSYSISNSQELMSYQRKGEQVVGDLHPDAFYGILNFPGDPNELVKVVLYPNPVHDELNIRCIDCTEIKLAELLNLKGQKVAQTQARGSAASLLVSHLPPGVYALRLTTEQGHVAQKVILY